MPEILQRLRRMDAVLIGPGLGQSEGTLSVLRAVLEHAVCPVVGDVSDFSTELIYGTLICNPPYGERLGDAQMCERLYNSMGKAFSKLNKWSYYILTSNENFEKCFGKKAGKKRKLYNGMLRCNIYQYFGERPPKPE